MTITLIADSRRRRRTARPRIGYLARQAGHYLTSAWTAGTLWLLTVAVALVASPLDAPLPAVTWKALAIAALAVSWLALIRLAVAVVREVWSMPDDDLSSGVECGRRGA